MPLTIREVREWFEWLATAQGAVDDPSWTPAVQRFASDMLGWLAGNKSDKAACGAISRMLSGTAEKEVEGE